MSRFPSKNSAPRHLSPAARRWWRVIARGYGIEDPAGLLLLVTALEGFDRMKQAEQIIGADGPVLTDRFGQRKGHPACTVERDSRSALLVALKALMARYPAAQQHDDPGERFFSDNVLPMRQRGR